MESLKEYVCEPKITEEGTNNVMPAPRNKKPEFYGIYKVDEEGFKMWVGDALDKESGKLLTQELNKLLKQK